MGSLWRSLVRVNSFTGKELREVVRRPGVLFSMIFGPFVVMLLFGLGYSGRPSPFATEIVIPEGTMLPSNPAFYEELAPTRINVVNIGNSRDDAIARLERGETELLVIAPENAQAALRNGEQATIEVAWYQIDPIREAWAQLATSTMVSSLNAEIVRTAADAGVDLAENQLGPRVENVSPEVFAEPTRAEMTNVAPTSPTVISFYGPAVLALILQHLAITFAALSMVRERLSGQIDMFRVAPVNALEVLLGKYLAYAVLSLLIAVPVCALLVYGLGVPMLGGVGPPIAIVLLLTLASLGIGLLISLLADSERQAVLLSMLVLLASVFLSGFVIPIADFVEPVQVLAYLLPVTHGIQTLQESMLRGSIGSLWMLGTLGAIALVLWVASLGRLTQVLRPAT